jgi:hypothetical protein
MRILKCPKCGREIPIIPVENGYMAECCDFIYFRPVTGLKAGDTEDDDKHKETE